MNVEWKDLEDAIRILIAGKFRGLTREQKSILLQRCAQLYAERPGNFWPQPPARPGVLAALVSLIARNLVRRAYRDAKREFASEEQKLRTFRSDLGARISEIEAINCNHPGEPTIDQLDLLVEITTNCRVSEADRENLVVHAVRHELGKSPDRPTFGDAAHRRTVEQFALPLGLDPARIDSIIAQNGAVAPGYERQACHRSLKKLREIAQSVAIVVVTAALFILGPSAHGSSARAIDPNNSLCPATTFEPRVAINIQHGPALIPEPQHRVAINIQHGAERLSGMSAIDMA